MKITRHGIVERPNNLPHISGAVVHGDTVYLQGVTPDPVCRSERRHPTRRASVNQMRCAARRRAIRDAADATWKRISTGRWSWPCTRNATSAA